MDDVLLIEMNESKPLDRVKMEEAFTIMGRYLLNRKALGEIAVYGGSAILLQFEWRTLSQDVDARIISDGNHGLIIEAVQYAARQLGLSSSWLNESVAMYARRGEMDADRIFVGTYPSADRYGLRVTAAKPSYILAMKLKVLQRATAEDRDFNDAINPGVECAVTTVEGLREVFSRFFADEELPFAAGLRLRELAAAIQARRR